jgi:hypothetical protein
MKRRAMRSEYNFNGAERGKFHRPDPVLEAPIYLDSDVQAYLSKRAEKTGASLDSVVNELLRKEIAVLEK